MQLKDRIFGNWWQLLWLVCHRWKFCGSLALRLAALRRLGCYEEIRDILLEAESQIAAAYTALTPTAP